MLRSTLFAIAVSTIQLSACGGATNPSPAASPSGLAAPAAELKKPGEAKIGDRTGCPVGGQEFIVTDTSPKLEYEGKTYFFCCASCVDTFKADPKKYLATTHDAS